MPSWWNAKDNSLGVNVTLKLKSRKSTSATGVNLLGLNSLLDFNWRFAVGEDITITESEFMKIVSLKAPIVNVRGRWVHLRKEEVKSALKLLEHYRKNEGMPLGEALSLMINGGGGGGEEKNLLQFKFEYYEKEVEEIFSKLTNSDASSLVVLQQPEGFNGILRELPD